MNQKQFVKRQKIKLIKNNLLRKLRGGDVAAVKRLVNARSIFLEKGALSHSYTSCVDDYDTLGISVMDLMSRNETKQHMRNNNLTLANDVRKILFDNNFEVAVKKVKTLSNTSYGNSTELRIKNVNSDFSQGYRDATGISDKPVVFSGGLFSDLTSWEINSKFFGLQKTPGLAKQMAGEGWDVWEIEMTGGPDTDCSTSDIDTCPNYKYDDLKDHYWPTSIAGIMKYSGKNQIDYVGHSNGCRTALSSLNSYSGAGKNNAGYYFDYTTGSYLFSDLPANVVRKFVGLGCPTRLNSIFSFTRGVRKIKNGVAQGDQAIIDINRIGKTHINGADYSKRISPSSFIPGFLIGFFTKGNSKISLSLMDFYNDLATSTSSEMNLSGVNVSQLYIFAGNDSFVLDEADDAVNDKAVPFSDNQYIDDETALNIEIISRDVDHGNLKSDDVIQEQIKGVLR